MVVSLLEVVSVSANPSSFAASDASGNVTPVSELPMSSPVQPTNIARASIHATAVAMTFRARLS